MRLYNDTGDHDRMTDQLQDVGRPLLRFGRQFVQHVRDDDVTGLAAELGYRFFLALFPFAIFVAGVAAFIARRSGIENPAEKLVDQLAGTLPSEAATLVSQELQRVIEQQNAGLVSFGVLSAIFVATGGTNALIKAMNRTFGVAETRPLWRRYLVALGMTLLAGSALITAFVIFLSGRIIAGDVAEDLGLSGAMWDLLPLLRWPLIVIAPFLAAVVLFRVGPNLKLPLRWIVPGALAFSVGWLIATWVFGIYVTEFASYGSTYGALGGVAILLIWFYLTAFILLLGVELNETIASIREPGELRHRRRATADGHNAPSSARNRSAPDPA